MKTREPEIIEQEIKKLQIELVNAKLERQKICIWDDNNSVTEDKIGFFDLSKARIILTNLVEGKKLLLEHGVIGNFTVYMNPQRNRILVERFENSKEKDIFKNDKISINEDTIESFILWHPSNWYILNENYL